MTAPDARPPVLSLVWRDFRRTWPQLILTDLLSRALGVVVLTPLVGLLLKLFLLATDDSVLTDTDIALFALHPYGLTALGLIGAVSLGLLCAESGIMMVVGYGAVENRRVTYLDALVYVSRRALSLMRLAGALVVRLLLIAAPFLGAIDAIYFTLLGDHDINYYLSARPPEFHRAVLLAGAALLIFAAIVLQRTARWILAVPLALFGDSSGGLALRDSAAATRGDTMRISGWLLAWLAFSWSLTTAATYVIGRAGGLLAPHLGADIRLVLAGLGLTLVFAGLANLAAQVVSASIFPLLIVRLYVSRAGSGRLDPPIAARGTLGAGASLQVPGKIFVGAAAVAVLGTSLAAYAIALHVDEDQTAAIIAHRGASSAAPENSMAAFERAVADGADWIELDVQENADGTIVVAHDSDFMKLARNPLKVWNATDADLRSIDIGGSYGPDFAGQRVPTLSQVLQFARDRIGVVIELKYYGHQRQLESRVIDTVEETGMGSKILLMSLDRAGLRRAAAMRPQWRRGLLATVSLGDMTRLDVDFLALNAAAATPSQIHLAHQRGMKVYVWTINDPVQMSVMLSRGADGIITDDPAAARRVLALREQLSPLGHLAVWIAGEAGLLRDPDETSDPEDA